MSDPLQLPTAALVAELRQAASLTQEELARQLGVSFSTVNAWEAGRSEPQTRHRRRLMELASSVFADEDSISVLIVDDDETDRRLAETVIADAADVLGIEVSVVGESDPVRALMQLGRLRPVLALLDVFMPVLDGFELADRVRGIEALNATELVFVTAGRDEVLAQQADERGLTLLDKPLAARDAGQLLREAVRGSGRVVGR